MKVYLYSLEVIKNVKEILYFHDDSLKDTRIQTKDAFRWVSNKEVMRVSEDD